MAHFVGSVQDTQDLQGWAQPHGRRGTGEGVVELTIRGCARESTEYITMAQRVFLLRWKLPYLVDHISAGLNRPVARAHKNKRHLGRPRWRRSSESFRSGSNWDRSRRRGQTGSNPRWASTPKSFEGEVHRGKVRDGSALPSTG